ncbi:MAG: hypothetical protein KA187_05470 [Arenimonas sp.]|nr:hypothetical protein [Arenimonas sp.]
MIATLAFGVVLLTGAYFLALAAMCLFAPARARRFLLGLVGSASMHYLELSLRLLAGAAFLVHAPRMLAPGAFQAFGWLLLLTTAVLLLLPWRWHQAFARQMVPRALPFLPVIGLASLGLGVFVLVAAQG